MCPQPQASPLLAYAPVSVPVCLLGVPWCTRAVPVLSYFVHALVSWLSKRALCCDSVHVPIECSDWNVPDWNIRGSSLDVRCIERCLFCATADESTSSLRNECADTRSFRMIASMIRSRLRSSSGQALSTSPAASSRRKSQKRSHNLRLEFSELYQCTSGRQIVAMATSEPKELKESKYEPGTYFLGSETWQVRHAAMLDGY